MCVSYFAILQWLPIGSLGKKASLWCILGVPSIWWIDLQVDGVRKGYGTIMISLGISSEGVDRLRIRSLSKQQKARLPGPGSVIASSLTTPIDAVYLAAIFDPIFTASYPTTRQVEHISLLSAVLRTFAAPETAPPPGTRLVDISALLQKYPNRPIVLFPECTTTNSRGILPLSHSLLGVPAHTKIFPVSLRYTPVDVVTPVPGCYGSFLWTLLGRGTHCIRVRIAEYVIGGAGQAGVLDESNSPGLRKSATATVATTSDYSNGDNGDNGVVAALRPVEKDLLDHVGDSLARLGRVKRVGLGVQEKRDFVRMWTRMRRTW